MKKEGINDASKKRRKKINGLWFYIAFMAIPVLQFLVFYVGVNANSFLLAFQSYDRINGGYKIVGFDNFVQVYREFSGTGSVLTQSLKNSFIIYFVATAIELPLSLFFAYYIYKKKPFSEFYRVVLFLPSIISAVVFVTLFKVMVESGYKQLCEELFKLHDVKGLLSTPKTKFGTLLFYHIWVSFGTTLLVYSSAMSGVSDEIIEAAAIDGVSPMQELVKIVLPQIWPTISTFLTVGIVGIFTDQAHLYTFYRDQSTVYTVGYYLFVQVMGDTATLSDYPVASAMGLIFTFVAVPITLVLKWLLQKIDPVSE